MSNRKLWPLAVLALVAGGCGSGAAGSDTTNNSGTTQSTKRDRLVKFAECLRTHGVPDFPDPNARDEFEYGVSVSGAVWQRATDACKRLEPPGTFSSKRTPKQQSASLRFARCMRANGVKDFPDPINGEPLIDTNRIPSSAAAGGMTILNATIQRCRTLLDRAAAGR